MKQIVQIVYLCGKKRGIRSLDNEKTLLFINRKYAI